MERERKMNRERERWPDIERQMDGEGERHTDIERGILNLGFCQNNE
jgi:hypothetical protein